MVKILIFLLQISLAHEGPPYPVVVDHPTAVGPVSVWTDPDVGGGKFLILTDGEPSVEVAAARDGKSDLSASAVRDPEIEKTAKRKVYVTSLPFPSEGQWQIEVRLSSQAGQERLKVNVDVTPPGPSQIEFVVYLFPFVLLAVLWLIGTLKMRRRRRQATSS